MPRQAKAGNVGGSVHANLDHGIPAEIVELDHARAGCLKEFFGTVASLVSRGYKAGAQGLGQHQLVARPSGGIGNDVIGMNRAGYGQAELDLDVAHRVAANHGGPGLLATLETSFED